MKTYVHHQDIRNGAIDDKYDAIIWMGDYNSRVQESYGSVGNSAAVDKATNKAAVRRAMNKSDYPEIFANDQFNVDMMSGKTPYNARYYNFREGDASLFAPTFKLIPDTSTLNINHRTPSWTDRILYRSRNLGYTNDKGDILTLVNYDSNNLVNMSDHRPVFA